MLNARVKIKLKPGVLDPQGTAIRNSLHTLGFSGVEDVRIGKFIEIRMEDGDRRDAVKNLEKMCDQLLANPVIESYEIELAGE